MTRLRVVAGKAHNVRAQYISANVAVSHIDSKLAEGSSITGNANRRPFLVRCKLHASLTNRMTRPRAERRESQTSFNIAAGSPLTSSSPPPSSARSIARRDSCNGHSPAPWLDMDNL